MTIIVSDTSPLSLLIRIGQVELLPALFTRVFIPDAVARELSHGRAPPEVTTFAASFPDWVHVRSPRVLLSITELDAGEVAAISLAVELGAPLMIDERLGRQIAVTKGVAVVGAIGILELAADRGLVADLAAVHDRIRAIPFRVSSKLLTESFERHRRSKQTP